MIDKKTKQYIFKAIRDVFTWSEQYAAHFTKGRTNACDICKKLCVKSEMELDHDPDPVVPFDLYWYELSVKEYYNRVWCLPARKVCKPCHKEHTKLQRKERSDAKKSRPTNK